VLTVDSEGFPRTGWTLVLEAGQGHRQALEQLCRAYWTAYRSDQRLNATSPEVDDVSQLRIGSKTASTGAVVIPSLLR